MPAMRYVLACAHALSFEEHKQNLEQVSVPVLSLWAKDDPLIEEECFVELKHTLRNVKEVVFDTGGHNVQKHQSTVVAQHIQQFLKK